MAIAEMQKVRMALHKSVADEVIGKLQELGCCQFIPQGREQVDERDVAPLREKLRKADDLLGEIRFALRFLDPYATEKGSGIARALGDVPQYSLDRLAHTASEEAIMEAVGKLRLLEKRVSDAKSRISRVVGLQSQIAPLVALPYPFEMYTKGTEFIAGALYAVPMASVAEFRTAAGDVFGEMAEIFSLPVGEKETTQIFSLMFPRQKAGEWQAAISKLQVSRLDVPAQLRGTPAEELAHLREEEAEQRAADEQVAADIEAVANDVYRLCQLGSDYWTLRKMKLESLIEGEQTEQILLVSFWQPKACEAAFRTAVEPYQGLVEIVLEQPQEGEQPPTLLKNASWAAPLEALTTMYGTPTYGKLDPSTIITPFFYLFFGMCFGDAGYGLVIASLLLAIMLKKKVTGTLRKFMTILMVGNLVAIIYGAITFSWFGDAITAFPFLEPLGFLGKLQKLNPMDDPMTLLAISLVLGFFQIMVGLVLAMRENLRAGDRVAAFADQGGWIVFLCGLVMVGISGTGAISVPMKASAAVAGAGALILVATQGRDKKNVFGKLFSGVMSLYNVTGYLGDILSYSRLLALGLGSAAVAMVINLLANLVTGIPFVGGLLAVLVFVGGHLFAIAVNMLGAFVHSLRLQYVEFFSKFYDAAGLEFKPLAMSTQYVKLSDSPDAGSAS